ncbi:rCG52292 [Rattus norvegicus]|uniref:RCG52292 n=1 Tax=Rattus norvegicus TaxID=10116 RepID=A6K0G4_RAT|nr:rCG52292 [Rattus norvegicus]
MPASTHAPGCWVTVTSRRHCFYCLIVRNSYKDWVLLSYDFCLLGLVLFLGSKRNNHLPSFTN